MTKKTPLKIIILLLKLTVSLGLIFFLFSKIGTLTVVENLKKVSPLYFVFAVFLYLLQLLISTKRWSLLIERPLPLKRLYSLYLIGAFFGIFLPGLVGGDTVKAYYLNKMLKEHSSLQTEANSPTLVTAIASVFMDRYMGFVTIIILVIVVFPLSVNYLINTPFIWILPISFTAFVLVSFLLLRFKIGQGFSFISNFYTYLSFYLHKSSVFTKTILLSFVTQLAGISAVYVLSKGLTIELSFLTVTIFLPIIILVSFIPISIAGIGLREGAFVFFFGIAGVPADKSLSLSILWFLANCTASLTGLIEYLRIKGSHDG